MSGADSGSGAESGLAQRAGRAQTAGGSDVEAELDLVPERHHACDSGVPTLRGAARWHRRSEIPMID